MAQPTQLSWTLDEAAGTLSVAGDIDQVSVSELTDALKTALASGRDEVVMNLDGVTHLASIGVAALVAAMRDFRDHGSTFSIEAASGTVAHMVLRVTGIPHNSEPAEA